MELTIKDGMKILKSENFNSLFNLSTGFTATWGKTKEEDPDWCEFGPLIADIEITTRCSGVNKTLCKYCYKANTPNGKNMSFETFKQIIEKLNVNQQLHQVAFGLGSSGEENPALWDMCKYLRNNNIIPNGTVADISDETAQKIANNFGACAISLHLPNIDICYNNVKKLTDLGMKQTNIHFVLCQETLNAAHKHLNAVQNDERLKKLNATVFLSLKSKGRAEDNEYTPITNKQFSNLINKALERKINIGFDSCSGRKFEKAIKHREDFKQLMTYVDPCESTLFSAYVNVFGEFYPCSFTEGTEKWKTGVEIIGKDFIKEVWNSHRVSNFRKILLEHQRSCPIYKI